MGRIAINKPDTNLDTEVTLLQSDLLDLQVIKTLNLDKMPEFGGNPSSGPTDNLAPDPLQNDSARTTAVLSAFKGGLRVALKPNTRVVEIHYTSANPRLAATIVNTLANTYIEQNFKTKFESTMQASDWLSNQLLDLQIKVETAPEKLVKFQKEHEILGTDEKQNIITEKLAELNKELTSAESMRREEESVYRLVQSGDPDVVASTAGALKTGWGERFRRSVSLARPTAWKRSGAKNSGGGTEHAVWSVLSEGRATEQPAQRSGRADAGRAEKGCGPGARAIPGRAATGRDAARGIR